MSAASLAASVPRRPMATPMWAALSAGTSLTPSPVIAAISPSASAPRRSGPCAPGPRARRRRPAGRCRAVPRATCASSCGPVTTSRPALGRGDAGRGGDAGRRARMVARDHDRPTPASRASATLARAAARGVSASPTSPTGSSARSGSSPAVEALAPGDHQDAQALLGPLPGHPLRSRRRPADRRAAPTSTSGAPLTARGGRRRRRRRRRSCACARSRTGAPRRRWPVERARG